MNGKKNYSMGAKIRKSHLSVKVPYWQMYWLVFTIGLSLEMYMCPLGRLKEIEHSRGSGMAILTMIKPMQNVCPQG